MPASRLNPRTFAYRVKLHRDRKDSQDRLAVLRIGRSIRTLCAGDYFAQRWRRLGSRAPACSIAFQEASGARIGADDSRRVFATGSRRLGRDSDHIRSGLPAKKFRLLAGLAAGASPAAPLSRSSAWLVDVPLRRRSRLVLAHSRAYCHHCPRDA